MISLLSRLRVYLLLGLLFPSHVFSAEEPEGEWLVLSGSNTIGAKLGPSWAHDFLTHKGVTNIEVRSIGTNEFKITGTTTEEKQVWITVRAHGSSTGFKSLEAGTADIGMASRAIKNSEVDALSKLSNAGMENAEHVVAIDGLSIIVNPNNAIDSLDLKDIQSIFLGKIKNWKELGGADKAIKLHARDNNSGTWDTFKTLVLKGEANLSRSAKRYESNDELAADVVKIPGAIGFVALSSVGSAKVVAVSDGNNPRMLPNKALVATEDYPLARRLYLYTNQINKSPFVQEFINFAVSYEGQQIVEQVGFISQNPQLMKTQVVNGPKFYQSLSEQGLRVSMNFRFSLKGATLDSKAKYDVQRLATFLTQADHSNYRVQLVGFSHPSESESFDTIISKLRASAVKRELFQYKVQTEPVVGMGSQHTIASGSGRNDRVEVWLYKGHMSSYRHSDGIFPTEAETTIVSN